MPRNVSQEKRDLIIPTYKKLGNCAATAKVVGVSPSLVQKYVREAGIANPYAQRLYNVDDRYFQNIDSEDKAYFLGLIAADGCLYKFRDCSTRVLKLSLKEEDRYIIERFKDHIKAENPIALYRSEDEDRRNQSAMATITIASREIFSDLSNLGIGERKSDTLQFPTSLKDEWLRHFVRGYFDGDGSVHWNRKERRHLVSFCGTKAFLESLREYLQKNGVLVNAKLGKRHENDFNMHSLSFNGRKRMKAFFDLVYHNATMFLVRKYDVFVNNFTNYARLRLPVS